MGTSQTVQTNAQTSNVDPVADAAKLAAIAAANFVVGKTGESGLAWLISQEVRKRFMTANGCDGQGVAILNPQAWAHTVARRLLLNENRRQEPVYQDLYEEAAVSPDLPPDDALARDEFLDKLQRLLWEALEQAEPDERQREELANYFLTTGVTAAQAASALRISANAFYLRKMRFLDRIEELVRKQLSLDERDELDRLF
jgi:DNA-directed RNA polymerase specialized sigma24 family protein